jgi:hypothetical protein
MYINTEVGINPDTTNTEHIACLSKQFLKPNITKQYKTAVIIIF